MLHSHKIDGVELNDLVNFATNVPEAENGPGFQVLLTEMQARTPIYNRQQPIADRFTFLTYVLFDSDADYQSLVATVKSLYGPGPHTYEHTPAGGSSRTTTVYFDGAPSTDPGGVGAVTARAIAPNPLA